LDFVDLLILGFVAGVAVAPLALIARFSRDVLLDRTSRQRIERRIDYLNPGARRTLGTWTDGGAGSSPGMVTIRGRLVRDASAMLVVFGAFVMLAVGITVSLAPTGSVLGVTSPPDPPGGAGMTGPSARTPIARTAPLGPAQPDATEAILGPGAQAPESPLQIATPRPTDIPVSPRPRAISDRMAVLAPCPDRSDCFIYVVRRGDNLVSIANWFGIPYETVLRLNRQLRDPGRVHAGDQITLPTPTR
jgi:hypothetical protein